MHKIICIFVLYIFLSTYGIQKCTFVLCGHEAYYRLWETTDLFNIKFVSVLLPSFSTSIGSY